MWGRTAVCPYDERRARRPPHRSAGRAAPSRPTAKSRRGAGKPVALSTRIILEAARLAPPPRPSETLRVSRFSPPSMRGGAGGGVFRAISKATALRELAAGLCSCLGAAEHGRGTARAGCDRRARSHPLHPSPPISPAAICPFKLQAAAGPSLPAPFAPMAGAALPLCRRWWG